MMTNKTSDYDLTVIVPVYNERGNMLRLETALSAFLKKSKVKSCILFVNDGSQDGSGDLIREICRRNKDFFYIGLAKNCGLSAAMKAGIDYTCSRLVGYIDADLQTTPEDFNLLLEYTDDYELVMGIRVGRKDSLVKNMSSKVANGFRRLMIVPVLPLVPVVLLLFLEPHMSGILLTTAIVGTILMLTGCGGVLTWCGAAAAALLLKPALTLVESIGYLQDRLNTWSDDLEALNDQTKQSLYAIGSGGLKGLGLGNSVEKQLWLPESTNDFIFSVVCEELGFIGAVLIIVLFILLIAQGLMIAYKAENQFCTMVGIGIMAQIAWQVFCNIAVVTNTIPNTGISLPFFSSGGTSLILLLAEMGVMVNIGRNGERAAQQRAAAHAQRQAAKAQRDAELKDRTINLDDARRARNEL